MPGYSYPRRRNHCRRLRFSCAAWLCVQHFSFFYHAPSGDVKIIFEESLTTSVKFFASTYGCKVLLNPDHMIVRGTLATFRSNLQVSVSSTPGILRSKYASNALCISCTSCTDTSSPTSSKTSTSGSASNALTSLILMRSFRSNKAKSESKETCGTGSIRVRFRWRRNSGQRICRYPRLFENHNFYEFDGKSVSVEYKNLFKVRYFIKRCAHFKTLNV